MYAGRVASLEIGWQPHKKKCHKLTNELDEFTSLHDLFIIDTLRLRIYFTPLI